MIFLVQLVLSLLLIWLVGPGVCLGNSLAAARFQHTDAQQIDPVFHVNTETFNDIYSYRPPPTWQSLKLRPFVFYMQAGSLNTNRFAYERLLSAQATYERWSMRARSHQTQDLVTSDHLSEIGVAYQFGRWQERGLWLGLLADGDSFKEFGDLGVSILWQEPQSYLEVKYWSVDHYYKTKKSDESAKRVSGATWAVDVDLMLLLTNRIQTQLSYHLSSPVEWRLSDFRQYSYDRQVGEFSMQAQITDRKLLQFHAKHQEKRESLQNVEQSMQPLEWMKHQITTVELALQDAHVGSTAVSASDALKEPNDVVEFTDVYGLAFIERQASYNFDGPLNSLGESSSQHFRAFHNELATYAKWALPVNEQGDHGASFYHGPNLHFVRLQERGEVKKTIEAKWQLAFEKMIGKHGRFFLNSTWDLDQLIDDAPYRKKPFRPWGGGDMQFIWSF